MNMALVMMGLGPFRFGIRNDLYQTLSRSSPYRWHGVDRQGRAPALQYAGKGTETINLSGVIYPHFRGGLRQVDLIRAQAGTGVPFMLVDGMGWVWKRWVITQVSETRELMMADGAPRRIEFKCTLKAYGQDGRPGLTSALNTVRQTLF